MKILFNTIKTPTQGNVNTSSYSYFILRNHRWEAYPNPHVVAFDIRVKLADEFKIHIGDSMWFNIFRRNILL